MIDIIINNRIYHCPQSDSELTTGQFAKIASIFGENDKNLENKLLLEYLCGVEREIVDNTDPQDIDDLVNDLLADIIIGALSNNTKSELKSGEICFHNGMELKMPENEPDLAGENMPLRNISALQFCEASDLFILDRNFYAATIVAILTVPQKQIYSDQRVKFVAEKIADIPLDTTKYILNELRKTHKYFKKICPYCYRNESVGTKKNYATEGVNLTWNDLLLFTANYIPSEIKHIEKMNCYEFMRIANSKLKIIKS